MPKLKTVQKSRHFPLDPGQVHFNETRRQPTNILVGLILSWVPKPASCALGKPQAQPKGRSGKAWWRKMRKGRTTRCQINSGSDHTQVTIYLQNYFVHISLQVQPSSAITFIFFLFFFFFPLYNESHNHYKSVKVKCKNKETLFQNILEIN